MAEEKTIIEGQLEKGGCVISFISAGLWLVLAGILLFLMTLFKDGAVFLVFLLIIFIGMSVLEIVLGVRFLKSGISVTDQNVYIRGKFKYRVFPHNAIISANTYKKTGITVTTVSGSINIASILNNQAVCAEINRLVQSRQAASVPQQAPQAYYQQPAVSTEQTAYAELEKLKQLLDSGVITQEDFDAKKKQLLGL